MANPSSRSLDYVDAIEEMKWPELRALWIKIKDGNTPGWDPGKALEHLIVRAFRLSKLDAEYPYDVPPGGKPLEQIDGVIYFEGLVFLIESKDTKSEDISAIAKLKMQLDRRPATVFGMIFLTGPLTMPAIELTSITPPHRILLWQTQDIEAAIKAKNFRAALQQKYRKLCRYGLIDGSSHWRDLEV
jgi:hypothetical protein